MVCTSALAALALGLGLTTAAPSLFKRNDFDICPQVGTTTPIPDHNTFQLPLQGMHQNMSWPFNVGSAVGNVDFDFVQYTWTFTFTAITGYTYTEADIWLGKSAPTGPQTPQYTTSNGFCQISADATTVTCTIPYSSLVGGTTNLQWLAGMCPNGDSQGLFYFIQTNAQLVGPSGPVQGQGQQSCTDFATTCSTLVPYWELTYRCSFCQSSTPPPPPPPPPTEVCELGTAYGYNPTGSGPKPVALNSLSPLPSTCKHWGWYFTPTAAQLSAGFSGTLLAGAAQNDPSKGTLVGSWSASVSGGQLVVTYTLLSGYSLSEVHVDFACTAITKCSPGQFTYGNTNAAALGSTFTVPPLTIPSCGPGSQLFLIIHAVVDQTITGTTCPAPLPS